jgi:hypothetical protein
MLPAQDQDPAFRVVAAHGEGEADALAVSCHTQSLVHGELLKDASAVLITGDGPAMRLNSGAMGPVSPTEERGEPIEVGILCRNRTQHSLRSALTWVSTSLGCKERAQCWRLLVPCVKSERRNEGRNCERDHRSDEPAYDHVDQPTTPAAASTEFHINGLDHHTQPPNLKEKL